MWPGPQRRLRRTSVSARSSSRCSDEWRRSSATPPRPKDWDAEPEPALEAKNLEPGDSRWAGWFKVDPGSFGSLENRSMTEARTVAADAVSRLALAPRAVVVLRDVAGWSGDEISQVLGIDPEMERRLLHIGRSRVRRALERAAARKPSRG